VIILFNENYLFRSNNFLFRRYKQGDAMENRNAHSAVLSKYYI
jgi:hypothetical protein